MFCSSMRLRRSIKPSRCSGGTCCAFRCSSAAMTSLGGSSVHRRPRRYVAGSGMKRVSRHCRKLRCHANAPSISFATASVSFNRRHVRSASIRFSRRGYARQNCSKSSAAVGVENKFWPRILCRCTDLSKYVSPPSPFSHASELAGQIRSRLGGLICNQYQSESKNKNRPIRKTWPARISRRLVVGRVVHEPNITALCKLGVLHPSPPILGHPMMSNPPRRSDGSTRHSSRENKKGRTVVRYSPSASKSRKLAEKTRGITPCRVG